MNQLPQAEEMREAIARRDAGYDGVFWFGVASTGIFCRPSCSARPARSDRQRYFATIQQALFAGFRACKRCRPLEAGGEPPAWAARLIAELDAEPGRRIRAAELRARGLTPEKVRRWFQQHYGLSFTAYSRGRRMNQAFQEIRAGASGDEVAAGVGYASLSGFRAAFERHFGAPPGQAPEDCLRIGWIESPLGPLLAGASQQAIVLLEFTDRRLLEAQLATLQRRLRLPAVPGDSPLLARLRVQLGEYFDGRRQRFDLPLQAPGTAFQEQVWAALQTIPPGQTRSYEWLAEQVGSPRAVRAVGTANGCNRIAILIPCHRVVNKSGQLGGYGGGLWRKQRLLEIEGARAPALL
ncbi:MAG TPA: methylated-DNA--[protein]-cysteine S-methyltransferase [Nevskiaceae bacterium]|nr:methylated-DNA--[protein]-cysteine S-methyltransferase [Nevskiaceae bacterium]